jgi:hypothetical protein
VKVQASRVQKLACNTPTVNGSSVLSAIVASNIAVEAFMTSRAVRLTLLVLFVIAVGVTAYLFWMGESRTRVETQLARTYDERAAATAREITVLRAAQQAYVAAGQGDQFWAGKVTASLATVRDGLAQLKADSASLEAQSAIDTAVGSMHDFEQIDRRARDYARSGQKLLASDIIFADGVTLTAAASTAIDEARAAELALRAETLSGINRRQLFAVGAATAAAFLVVLLLVPLPRTPLDFGTPAVDAAPATAEPAARKGQLDSAESIEEEWQPAVRASSPEPSPASLPVSARAAAVSASSIDLGSIATVCTDLARLADTSSLPSLLERAAAALDANGIVLWIADPDGNELSPIVTHGYSPYIVTRLGTILRDDENATAAAFRTGLVQTVKTDEISAGAIAAPLVTPTGSVGVMAAEVRHSGEQDAGKLAAATIVAAQLATLVGPPASRSQARAEAAG